MRFRRCVTGEGLTIGRSRLPNRLGIRARREHGSDRLNNRTDILGGPPESWSGARRWVGLQAAAEARGLAATRHGPYAPTLGGGAAAADAVLASRATAVVAHNDMLAIGVMLRLADRGVSVPGDVSVVGFDNIVGSDFCSPALTTLAERTEDAGARAVEAVVAQTVARSSEPPTRVLPTQLVVRRSTGPAPGRRQRSERSRTNR